MGMVWDFFFFFFFFFSQKWIKLDFLRWTVYWHSKGGEGLISVLSRAGSDYPEYFHFQCCKFMFVGSFFFVCVCVCVCVCGYKLVLVLMAF